MDTTDLIIPVVENDPSDYATAKNLLESRENWLEVCGSLEWLNHFKIKTKWIDANTANLNNEVNKEKALKTILKINAPLVVLDLGLTGREENYIREDFIEKIQNEQDLENFWNSEEIKNTGGLWLVRELTKIKELGFDIPAIAIATSFVKITEGKSLFEQFILKKGATWIYKKPLSDIAAENILHGLALIMATQAQTQLFTNKIASVFYQAQQSNIKMWEEAQIFLFELLDNALKKQSSGTAQRDLAEKLGIAYNTYRSWMERIDDRNKK